MIQSFRTFLERELSELAVTQESLNEEEAEPARAEAKAQAKASAKTRASAQRGRAALQIDEPFTEERAPVALTPPAAAPLPLIEEPAAQAASEDDGPDWLSSIMEEKKQ
jgi:hypothetical protein